MSTRGWSTPTGWRSAATPAASSSGWGGSSGAWRSGGNFETCGRPPPPPGPFDLARQKEGWELRCRRAELRARIDVRWLVLIGETLGGEVVSGLVTGLSERFAHVDFRGLEGTIDFTEHFRRGRGFACPAETYAIGQRIEVVVSDRVILPGRRLALAPIPPWPARGRILERYPVGARATGEVVAGLRDGVHVRLEPGIAGTVHRNQMPPPALRRNRLGRFLGVGDPAEVVVLDIDPPGRTLHLSMSFEAPGPAAGAS